MKSNNLTLSKLVKLTGAKPYQVKYLHSLGKLPVVRGSQGAGIPILYHPDAIEIARNHLARGNTNDV